MTHPPLSRTTFASANPARQELLEAFNEGKTPYSIGKELAGWLEKLFEAKVKPNTLIRRAERQREKDVTTNVVKKSKPQQSPTVTPEAQSPNGHNRLTAAGGKKKTCEE